MDPSIAHFNHAGMSPTPEPVAAVMRAHLGLEDRIGGYEAAVVAAEALAAVPAQLARLIGARPHEVLASESATRAWEQALWPLADCLELGAGDRILVDQFAYATVYGGLARLALRRSVEIVPVPSHDDGTVDHDALIAAVDEATRMVVVTHMPTHLGTVTDVAAIGARLAGSGVVYVVDVSQTLGQLPVDVAAIGCDVAFAPGRKFLRSPRGTAMLYVAEAWAERMVPLSPGFGAASPARPGHFELGEGLRRFDQFESGTAASLGLGRAAELATELGIDVIAAGVADRSRKVIGMLDGIDGIERCGTDDDVGIISFVHDRLAPTDVQAQLLARGVNVWVNTQHGAPVDAAVRDRMASGSARLPSVRVSPHHVTTDDEIAQLDEALRSLS